MTRLEYSGRKQRSKGNPRQVVGCRNIFNMNLLIARKRIRPQLNCPDYYKYRALFLIILISAVAERTRSAQVQLQLVHKFLGRCALASGWDYLINLGFILAWFISLSWLLDIYQDSLLCQGQGARRVASTSGWVTRVSSMVKRAQSSIF
jgi:hypothetical protein